MKYPQTKDWPTEERIDRIGQNGGTGCHYKGTCPKCDGKSLVKRGIQKGFQRYQCKFCLYKFTHQG